MKLNYKEEEIRMIQKDIETKYNELSREKQVIDAKAMELIEIIKNQSKELNVIK